jgi:hypothetical protein
VVGEGRLRIWVLDRTGQVLRHIATGNEAVIERGVRPGRRPHEFSARERSTLRSLASLGAVAVEATYGHDAVNQV